MGIISAFPAPRGILALTFNNSEERGTLPACPEGKALGAQRISQKKLFFISPPHPHRAMAQGPTSCPHHQSRWLGHLGPSGGMRPMDGAKETFLEAPPCGTLCFVPLQGSQALNQGWKMLSGGSHCPLLLFSMGFAGLWGHWSSPQGAWEL